MRDENISVWIDTEQGKIMELTIWITMNILDRLQTVNEFITTQC
jgi:hypothetical protein